MLRRTAFTLVELLVVIAIIGLLVAILLPAIQASREASRKTQCKNNLKQISTAALGHESAQGFLPSSGWGFQWVGERDAGFGPEQPGGWAYNILPYMEYVALYDGAVCSSILDQFNDLDDVEDPDPEVAFRGMRTLVTTLVPEFSCPSKRPLDGQALDPNPVFDRSKLAYNAPNCTTATNCRVMRGDYRANSGNTDARDESGPGLTSNRSWNGNLRRSQNGVSYQQSTVRIIDILDGTSKTALVGEKYLNPDHYVGGAYTAEDQCVYSGHDNDNNGYTANFQPNSMVVHRPQQDRPGLNLPFHFGSAHAVGLHMAFCDGSVQFLDYDVDDQVWINYGGRNDEFGK